MTDVLRRPVPASPPRTTPVPGNFIADVLTLLELRADPDRALRPVSTRALDWAFVVLALLMTLGLWLDIWSHAFFGPDQSVFNEFHMLFYSSAAMLGGLLAYTHFTAVSGKVRWVHTLPKGYGIGTFGLLIFGVSGVWDLISHAMFGFETGFEATLSPSHVGLFIGWFVIGMTPVRAVLARRGMEVLTLGRSLPAIIGTSAAMGALSTVVIYALKIGGDINAIQANRGGLGQDELGYILGVSGQFIQTAIIAGFVLWWTVHTRLPRGAVTVLYSLYGLFMFIYSQDPIVPLILLVAGVLTDVAYAVIRPLPGHTGRVRLFGLLLPLILWGAYYGVLIIGNVGGGVWFTPYIWIGSIIQSGFIGLFIAYFMTLRPEPTLATAQEN